MFLVWVKPASYWDVIVAHLPMALLSGTVLALPLWVPLDALPLIPCTFYRFFGIPCPFCGFTRALWAITLEDWGWALLNCPLSLPFYCLAVLLFLWNVVGLTLGIQLKLKNVHKKSRIIVWSVGILFALNWLYRIVFHAV